MARIAQDSSVLNPNILSTQEPASAPYTFVESSMDAFIQAMRVKKSKHRNSTP